jgi:PAS domain S-box-containing protein
MYSEVKIAERKMIQDKMSQTQKKMEAVTRELRTQAKVLESMAEGVLVTDENAVLIFANPAVEKMFGYERGGLLGKSVAELNAGTPEEKRRELDRALALLRRTGAWDSEVLRVRKDGTTFTAFVRVRTLEVGGKLHCVSVQEDITEFRNTLQRLAESNRELERFAHLASHDLQEPLRTVASYVGRALQKCQLDPVAVQALEAALAGTKRMQALIDGMLQYASLSTRSREITETSAQEAVEKALGSLKATVEETGSQVKVEPLPTVYADSLQLERVFQNLLSNAIKYRKAESPSVRVWAERRPGEWEFHVQDNGIGFDPALSDRVWRIFERLHDRSAYPGSGVGLPSCKKIVEHHGGRIWVKSEPGVGSTFSFTLPDSPPGRG